MTRGLRQDEAFEEQLAALVPDDPVREAILDGVRATLCEDPKSGTPLDDPPHIMWYWIVPAAPAWDLDEMIGYYSFTDEAFVDLHWIDLR